MRGESTTESVLDAALVDVGDGHGRAARLTSHRRREQANSSGTDNECGGTWNRAGPIDRMDSHREGLEKSSRIVGDVVRKSEVSGQRAILCES